MQNENTIPHSSRARNGRTADVFCTHVSVHLISLLRAEETVRMLLTVNSGGAHHNHSCTAAHVVASGAARRHWRRMIGRGWKARLVRQWIARGASVLTKKTQTQAISLKLIFRSMTIDFVQLHVIHSPLWKRTEWRFSCDWPRC